MARSSARSFRLQRGRRPSSSESWQSQSCSERSAPQLQRGRRPSSSESCFPTPCASYRPWSSFNGADDLRRRRAQPRAGSGVPGSRLQRGRRPSSSERWNDGPVFAMYECGLQRGRRPSSSESASSGHGRRAPAGASTGPTTFVVGEYRRQTLTIKTASTGPTTFVVGETGGPLPPGRRAHEASTGPTTFVVGEQAKPRPQSLLPPPASTGPTTFVVGERHTERIFALLDVLLQRGRRPSSSESRNTMPV